MKKFLKILLFIVAVLGALFLFFRVPDTDPVEMRAKYGAAPSQFVETADGNTFHVRDEGPRDGPVIVLLHGSNADLHTWQPWVDALKGDYRFIRFDQIGHGLTGPAQDGDYSSAAFVDDVGEVADKLGLGRFVLGGNSMGGGIAMGYAIAHPERLTGLVLVDAGGVPVKNDAGGNLAFTLARMPVVGTAMAAMLPRSLVEKSLSQSVSNQAVVTPEAVDRYWEMARYPGNRAANRVRFGEPRRSFDAAAVAATNVPTLVMWGKEDALIPYSAAGWYMEHLPNATLAAYDGIGHLPMEEAPEQSAADLRRWLEKSVVNASPEAVDTR